MMRQLTAYVLAAIVILIAQAVARDNGQWAQAPWAERQWFREQRVPDGNGAMSGFPCCSEADGELVEEDIRSGHYWIKGGHFPVWTQVPDSLVIREPNKHGEPIVWWVGVGPYDIRCYAPGGGV